MKSKKKLDFASLEVVAMVAGLLAAVLAILEWVLQ